MANGDKLSKTTLFISQNMGKQKHKKLFLEQSERTLINYNNQFEWKY